MIRLKYKISDNNILLLSKNGKEFLPDVELEYKQLDCTSRRIGQIIAHDSLEHFSLCQDDNINELRELGALYAHRSQDFYNYFGENNLKYELSSQITNLYYNSEIPVVKSNPNCPEINELIDDLWNEYINIEEIKDLELSKHDLTNVKRLIKREMSKGYNYVNERIGRYTFSNMFYELKDLIENIVKNLDYGLEHILNIQINFETRELKHKLHTLF